MARSLAAQRAGRPRSGSTLTGTVTKSSPTSTGDMIKPVEVPKRFDGKCNRPLGCAALNRIGHKCPSRAPQLIISLCSAVFISPHHYDVGTLIDASLRGR